MSVVPTNREEKIAFYQSHLSPWGANAVEIGLTAQQVGDLASLVIDASNAVMAIEAARQASKTATQTLNDAVRAMHSEPGAGAAMVSTILSFAQTTGDPNVYTLAQIPPPQPASATPPPGIPTNLTVELLQDGSLKLRWKSDNPPNTSGTIYEIKRQGQGQSQPEYVGATGVREFLDDTLPSGDTPVVYQITGLRSTKRGNPAEFTVKFGTGGAQIISSNTTSANNTTENTQGVKLAA